MFIRRILAPVLRVLLSILTSVKPALLTVATDAYVLNKVSLVSTVGKVWHIYNYNDNNSNKILVYC